MPTQLPLNFVNYITQCYYYYFIHLQLKYLFIYIINNISENHKMINVKQIYEIVIKYWRWNVDAWNNKLFNVHFILNIRI